jgi:hypothetical protein
MKTFLSGADPDSFGTTSTASKPSFSSTSTLLFNDFFRPLPA